MGKTFRVSYIIVIFKFLLKYLSVENQIESKTEKGKLNSGLQNEGEGDQGRKKSRGRRLPDFTVL